MKGSLTPVPSFTVVVLAASIALRAQTPNIDQQVAAVSQELTQHNYFKAATLVSALQKQAQTKLGGPLAPDRMQQAMASCWSEQDVTGALSQALTNFQKAEWEGALYSFVSAHYGLSRLTAQTSAEERFVRGKAEAQKESSPAWWHQAARTALEAGHLPEALDYVNREIASTPKSYPARAYSLLLHRAYTLKGIIELDQNDVAASIQSLQASVLNAPPGLFTSVRPSMALAKQLLEKGQKAPVLIYLGRCSQLGWSLGQMRLQDWTLAVNSGKMPDFPPGSSQDY